MTGVPVPVYTMPSIHFTLGSFPNTSVRRCNSALVSFLIL